MVPSRLFGGFSTAIKPLQKSQHIGRENPIGCRKRETPETRVFFQVNDHIFGVDLGLHQSKVGKKIIQRKQNGD